MLKSPTLGTMATTSRIQKIKMIFHWSAINPIFLFLNDPNTSDKIVSKTASPTTMSMEISAETSTLTRMLKKIVKIVIKKIMMRVLVTIMN